MNKLILGLVTLLAASPLLHGAAAPAAPPAAAATAAKGTPIPLTTVPIIPSESSLAIRSRTTIPITRLPGYKASLWTGIADIRAAIAGKITSDPANIVQEYLGGINPLSAWNTPTAQVTEYHDSEIQDIRRCFWLDNHTLAFLGLNRKEHRYFFQVWNTTTNTYHSASLDCHASEPPTIAYNSQTKLFAIGTGTTIHLIDKELRTHQTFSCGDVATYIDHIAWSPDGTQLAIEARAIGATKGSPLTIVIIYTIATNRDNTELDVIRIWRITFPPPWRTYEYLSCCSMHYTNATTVVLGFVTPATGLWTANNTEIKLEEIFIDTVTGNITKGKQTYVITSERTYDEASHALLHIDGTIKDHPDQPDLYNIDYSITAYDSVTRLPQLTCTYTVGAKKNLTIHRIREALRYNAKQASPDLTKVVIISPRIVLRGADHHSNSILIIEPVPAT